MRWYRAAALVLAELVAVSAFADITSASLEIRGAGLRVETVSVTTGIDIPTTIQTSFAGRTNDEVPEVNGLIAAGDLTGPGIEVPITLTATPGHRFHVPALPRAGEYYLQNIRLMNGANVVQQAAPPLAKITVADLLQASLQVRQLSPVEIRARGIASSDSWDVYEYSFTFLVEGQTVVVPFPVIVDRRTHVVTPIVVETDYGLPKPTKDIQPPRWSPPDIIPFEFPDAPATDITDPGQAPRDRGTRPPRPRIPAALVIPNSLAALHQFFAVALTVTNGAPNGSTARLEDVAATMKIKVPDALRAVKSTPQVAFGQPVPVVDPNTGVTVLLAQAKGEAEWTLEGLKPGTHTVEVDIRATLRETGQDDIALRATPSATVVIHDPRFNITFSHPATVRKGVEYSTFAFITNMSGQAQTIRVADALPQCGADQTPNVCRVAGGPPAELTIPAGEMRIVDYRLRAGVTGQVFATAGTIGGEAVTAAVQLHMGVSASGIPLSPATLILPHYAQYLDPELVSINLELLGLGYSLATAPVNQLTARLPRVIKTDVFYRATDLARAGQRIFISNAVDDALSNLLLDLLGNDLELREWDQLRRTESAGKRAGTAVIERLRDALQSKESSMSGAVDRFAANTAHRGGYLLALAHAPPGAARPLSIDTTNIPFADNAAFDAFGRAGELIVVGRWTENVALLITPNITGPIEVELLVPAATVGMMRAHLTLDATAGVAIRIPTTSLNATPVAPAPLTILGARQDLHLDPEGHKVSLLFSRPVHKEDLLPKISAAIDFDRDGIAFTDARPIFATALQHDGRVVNLSFDHVLSTNANYSITVAPLIDPIAQASVSFAPIAPKIDNDRPAGIVYGRFLTGDNKPIADAEVRFFTGRWSGCLDPAPDCNPFAAAPQYARTRADASFLFEYVPRDVAADPNLNGGYKAVGVTPEGKLTAVEGAVRLPGRVHIVNLQLLGRGSAEGTVRYDDGTIAAGVRVHVSSTMFNVGRDTTTDAAGAFRVDDLAVGPVTFSASDDAGNVAFASGEIATPGQVAVKELVIHRKPFPGTGTVYGRVTRSDTGVPVFGARVGVYSQGYGFAESTTDSDGRFEFTRVPAGFVTLLAAEWSVSRENAAADFDLRPDETREMSLVLSVTPADMTFTRVTGRVLRENPLYPGDPSKCERVAGAVVNLAILTTTADANGEFAFDGVPVIAAGKTIRAYDPSTKRFAATTVPTLTEAGPNDVTVFIPAASYGGGTIRVRVLGANGLPADGFRVIESGFPPLVLTRVGTGIYEYRDAPVGHDVEIHAVDGPEAFGEQTAKGSMHLDFPGQTATLILRLPGHGTVRAKLRSDIDLIGDVSLTYLVWNDAEQAMEPHTAGASTSENGTAGFATFNHVPALQPYTIAGAHPVHGYAEQSGQLAYDGDAGIHTLQLARLSTVRGTVYAIDGITPVAGAAVRLDDGRRDPGVIYTSPDGTFVFHDVPAAASFNVTAEVTQSGIYRAGIAYGRTPDAGGPAPDTSIILRRRGSIEGRIVYADYKVYDPDDPQNRVADDTPGDDSDNAPVPLARFWLRELDWPERSFGSGAEPLVADAGGRFALSDVFTGSLRMAAWSAENQELRGDWTGELATEGQVLTGVYIAVGGGGTGSLQVKVVDPNQQYLPIPNAEVRVYRGGRLFDLSSTDDAGLVRFDDLPAGTYAVDAYSKSLGKSGNGGGVVIARDQLTEVRVLLEFSGKVDGRLSDPMVTPAKTLPGVAVKLTASSYFALTTTGTGGLFAFEGIREGWFEVEAKDTESNRWARGKGVISPANRRPFVELELERTQPLQVAVYLPDDTGGNSGVLAGPFEIDVTQRCIPEPCDYRRTLQGNPLVFPGLFVNGLYDGLERYHVAAREIGGAGRTLSTSGYFPADSLQLVYPAFGGVQVTVMQAGAPAAGARVEIVQGAERRSLFTDANGSASAAGLLLGNVTVQATSVDGRFSGSAGATIVRQSVPAAVLIELGAYAAVSGFVEAEAGGPSIGTRVVATFAGRTLEMLTGSDGSYLFHGIPTSASGTSVSLTYVGPDGVTVGARQSVTITNEWASRVRVLDSVTLDATPPQLVSLTPADGAQNVSPDAPVRLVFSEAIDPADLHAGNLQLIAADGSGQVACTITADEAFAVVLQPILQPGERFPLKSNTLYRIVVQSALRDLTGHRLPAARGATFTTSDYAEPRVIRLVPGLDKPLPAQVTLQFHFNEPVDPQSFVFRFYKLGAVVTEKPGRAYVDPATQLFLAFAPDDELEPESFYRATFSGVRDLQGNVLPAQTFDYASFDDRAPWLRLISPVPDGSNLVSGVQYTLNVDARNDSLDGPPATDVVKVEYVRVDGAAETPLTVATAAPFAYRFSAPEAPETGLTYTVRATGTDSSGNIGPPSTISWTVKPNATPKNVVVTLGASAAYPGAAIAANVTFEDEGILAPVQVIARGTNADGTEYVQSRSVEAKRDSVTQPWPQVALSFALPLTLKVGTSVTFTATVTDVRGLSATSTTALEVLADTIKPLIVSTSPAPETTYNLNATYAVSAVASDGETGVAEVQFVVDGSTYRVFAPANGSTFTSPQITATARNVDTRVPIVVRAIDHHGNVATREFDVIYVGVNDPSAPRGAWLCPIDRAVIPAAQATFKLPLKIRAQDDVSVTAVQFRVPGLANPISAARIGTGDDYEALLTIDTPAAGSDFTIAAIISDADPAHTIEVPIAIDVVAFDRIIDATEAVDEDNAPTYANRSLLVRAGGRLVINVPLAVRDLAVIEGGLVEILGTTVNRERKLDLTIADRLYVDCTSSIDVSGKGYLGGWGVSPDGSGTRNESATGRTAGNVTAGGAANAAGSHGGLGGALADGLTNTPYGSIIDPFDLGSGGAGHPASNTSPGGSGGGAASLRTSTSPDALARIVLAGRIRADGSTGRHGGSGGSVRIHARQLIVGPFANITAIGGAGQPACGSGADQCLGGSGGRISLISSERLDLMSLEPLRADGGATGLSGTLLGGAAGTIHVRRPGQANGDLYISQNTSTYTRSTPLANVTFDKLILGPYAVARVDGPFSIPLIEKDPTAVLVDRDAVPSISGIVSGSSLIRNTQLEAVVDLAAVGGIVSADFDFSAAPPKRVTTFAYPFTVDGHRVTWTVPADAPLGPATLKVKVIDRADRVTETTLATFTILDNTAPVIDTFTVMPSSLYPGRTVTATIAARDDVAVTRVSATSQIGTATSTQTRATSAKTVNETFTFTIPVDTPGGTPMIIEASVEDGFPNRVATKQLASVTILTDTIAPAATIDAPADAQLFEEAAGTIAVTITATDAEVAVKSVTARIGTGAVVPLTADASNWTGTLTIPAVDGDDIVSFPLTVTASDYAGNTATMAITIRIRPTIDPSAPTIKWRCGRDARVPAGATMKLRAEAVAANGANPVQKVEFFVDELPPLLATSIGGNVWEATWTIPAGAAAHAMNAVATASSGASRNVRTTITAVVADQIFNTNATIAANNTSFENRIIAVTAGALTISGPHTFTDLLILGGGITHAQGDTSQRLTTGTLYVGCDGTIDVSGRGYNSGATHPDATPPPSGHGGSHIGVGGSPGPFASTYGSVYRPQEAGGGGASTGAGGGVVSIDAATAIVDGTIRANAASADFGSGAGGSIWIRANRIGGTGVIEANGGTVTGTGAAYGGGGGGAVAIEYSDATSTLPLLRATASSAPRAGGAGTVYVKGPTSTFGELTIDNAGRNGQLTDLPSLGNGIAQSDTSGTRLVTAADIPAYFAGHWVEIESKGTWRITAVNAKTITLEAGANAASGDRWQGVYRFDRIHLFGPNTITSRDPIRLPANANVTLSGATASGQFLTLTDPLTAQSVIVNGNVALPRVTADSLTVSAGALLSSYASGPLSVEVNNLTIAATGSIDLTGRGYPARTTYLGETVQGNNTGGSHMGHGGLGHPPPGSTFGSIHRPQESGAGGTSGNSGFGGGVLTVTAQTVTVDGAIRSNGMTSGDAAGAGGSIWIRTAKISGAGAIEANGGSCLSEGLGGGGAGAVAIEYTDAASVLPSLRASASSANRVGGAGTVFVKSPSSIFGSLTIDNAGRSGQPTQLPSLGSGIAQPESSGTALVTDRASIIPPYFLGHWIEIDGKGAWRIVRIDGKTATLEAGANVAPDDAWRGIYRVDALRLRTSQVLSADSLRYAALDKDAPSTLTTNAAAPQFPAATRAQIAISGDVITGPAGAVTDTDAPIRLTATNIRTAQTFTANAAANGSFSIPVGGMAGDVFTLRATDSHAYPLSSAAIAVNGSLVETATLASLTLNPTTVNAGSPSTATVTLAAPARVGGVTVTLSSSNPAAVVPPSVTIAQGTTTAQFTITTSAVASQTSAVITATLASSMSATLTINPAAPALAALVLSAGTIEGGTSVEGTVTLTAPASANAIVTLASSSPLLTVPQTIVVPAGAAHVTFTVATSRVSATTSTQVTAAYGETRSAALALTACSTLPTAARPPTTPAAPWIDDLPHDVAFDSTQAASGALSLHFTASEGTRSWTFRASEPVTAKTVVIHALVNPCNPPREIVITSGGGTRKSWDDSLVRGDWTRLEIELVETPLTTLTITVRGGEAWFDAIGAKEASAP